MAISITDTCIQTIQVSQLEVHKNMVAFVHRLKYGGMLICCVGLFLPVNKTLTGKAKFDEKNLLS